MSYKVEITGENKLNKLFSVYYDKTTVDNDVYTYILISKIIDCELKVVEYSDNDLIQFYQLKEINDNCY